MIRKGFKVSVSKDRYSGKHCHEIKVNSSTNSGGTSLAGMSLEELEVVRNEINTYIHICRQTENNKGVR